ncbi:hypothetical protein SAMN04487764_1937 [Gillisia sp. Hel1_33_143]|uniref:hypothetical protein n=1 Tax=Gillisia sp. Hel1_33_143 TaxID=1336796 RepID=UPI00087973EE|nr:hypothetical protein [Gillisia sp. Hel1_33_143]SDS31403.1 hypothetical protein SAMN04487764_1937 [Gillisia sp. Hel1_33_143]
MRKTSDESFILKGISSYLNKRVWEIPENVNFYVQELRSQKKENLPKSIGEASIGKQPTDGSVDYRYNRRKVKGAKYHLVFEDYKNGKIKSNGIVNLKDGTSLFWYLWEGERPNISAMALGKGYIAALYDNELYDVKTHHSTFRSFGISSNKVRENLTIIAKPPVLNKNFGVYPDTARNALKIMGSKRAGEPLPWAEWGEEFSNNLPNEIIEALKKSINSTSGTIEDSKWRQKLSERFSRRWNQKIFKISDDGKDNISKTQTLNLFKPSDDDPNSSTKTKKNTALNVPKAKNTNSGSFDSGKNKANPSNAPRGIPDYRWVREEDVEEGTAAAWLKPSAQEPNGTVLLNSNFQVFEEVVKYWQDKYPDHFEEKVQSTIQDVYGQAMVARIAHSESLTRDKNWGRKRVDEELRSTSSLTMAILGLITEDHIIANKLGALLSKRQVI